MNMYERFQEISRTMKIIKGMIRTNCEQIRLLHANNKTCRESLKHWKEVRRQLVFPNEGKAKQ
jgi:hypothetical protein